MQGARQLVIWPSPSASQHLVVTADAPQLILLELDNGQCLMLLLALGELMRDVCQQYDMATPEWLDCRSLDIPLDQMLTALNREQRPFVASTLADWQAYFFTVVRWPIYCVAVERFNSQLPRKLSHFARCKRLFQPTQLGAFALQLQFAQLIQSWPSTIPLSFEHYNLLIHGDETVRRNRFDALRVFPLSAKLWGNSDPGADVLCHAIDTGQALIPGLAQHAQVNSEVARWCLPLKVSDLPTCLVLRPVAEIVQWCAMIAREKRPTSPAEWQIVGMMLQAWLGQMPWQSLVRAWLPTLSQLGWQNAMTKARQCFPAENPFEVIEDFLESLARYIRAINPQYQADEDGVRDTTLEQQLAQALSRLSPWQVLLAGRYWLRQLHRPLPNKQAVVASPRVWPSPLTSPWHHQLGYVIPLRSDAELIREGSAMHHCVASRAIDCIQSSMFIFSVRSPDDERLSTVQLKLNQRQDGGYHWTIYEHRGLQNSPPSAQAQILVRELLAMFNQFSDDELCNLFRKKTPASPEPETPNIDIAQLATERTIMAHRYLHTKLQQFLG
ncbi:PcfJ domain-containing protein [Chitinibacter bivalviorum]|uniref:PcfJ domain-containing protein n=1 Tax=Chitinibacter bivalviorum TaxID=2739434 RepID=A0A7H9BIL1_9NEIS|nr:PcfJ domain-containing protein [Chitinibacter bivalviorum]QLG88058.1 PcfJ domain-containing protein [Chitinibacter bivalviorum]